MAIYIQIEENVYKERLEVAHAKGYQEGYEEGKLDTKIELGKEIADLNEVLGDVLYGD